MVTLANRVLTGRNGVNRQAHAAEGRGGGVYSAAAALQRDVNRFEGRVSARRASAAAGTKAHHFVVFDSVEGGGNHS